MGRAYAFGRLEAIPYGDDLGGVVPFGDGTAEEASMWTGTVRSRSVAFVAALAVSLVACTPADSDPATTTVPSDSTSTTVSGDAGPTSTLDPALSAELPVDPDVITGTLDNGLRYYIRYNDSPGSRADLRLAVDVGSLQEDPDQLGDAHFLEHMMFNGTTRFPRNELISVLESFGPRFGPDINAYTSFDETVYLLSLPNDDDLIELGVDVLREWATEATLTESDVVDERGVVFEEWRLRDEGLAGRVNQTFQDLLFPGTPYEGKAPIGTPESIQATTPEVLARFYADWYRPERMAVIAVGDFDVEAMEDLIIDRFSTVTARADQRAELVGSAPDATVTKAAVLADPEVALTSIDLLWPVPAGPVTTVGERRQRTINQMALTMLATRLNDDALRGDLPLTRANNSSFTFTRAFSVAAISVGALPENTQAAVEALRVELARLEAHGFSEQEFQRALDEVTAAVQQQFEGRGSRQDDQFGDQLVERDLTGAPMMSPEQQYEVDTSILASLSVADMDAALADLFATYEPQILVVGPDEAAIPTPEQLVEGFTAPLDATPEPRQDPEPIDALMERPDPVFADDVEVDDTLGFATVTFPNGATVKLWQTTIAENIVTLEAVSFGGTSVVDVEDVPEAELITQVVARSGVGDADAATYRQFVADRLVSVQPWISETREGFRGVAASEDVEVMLQTLHLLMTAPRADDVAFDTVIAEYAAQDAARADTPDLVITDALIEAYYSGDPRYFATPSAAQLDAFDRDRARAIFEERFSNAGDFVFAFVGDFDQDAISELLTRYIGTLPGTAEREVFVDNQPLPPREVQLVTVEAGTDPQGELRIYFTNPSATDLEARTTARILELIVNANLRDRIREELAATYSPFGRIDIQRDPDPFAEASITVSGDPERLEEISVAVLDELDRIATQGPTAQEFTTAQQQLLTEMELVNNPQLAAYLLESWLYPDQPATELIERVSVAQQTTAADVRSLARIVYNPQQRIEIRLVPLGFG